MLVKMAGKMFLTIGLFFLQASSAFAILAPSARSFALLDPPEGPRAMAVAGISSAVVQGGEAVYWNPAALNGAKSWSLELGYARALAETSTQGLALTAPGPLGSGWGLDLRYASLGEFVRRDALGYEQGSKFQPWMMAARAGIAKSLGSGLPALGISMGWLSTQVDKEGGSAGEIVGSGQWELFQRITLLARIQSVGGRIGNLSGGGGAAWNQIIGKGWIKFAVQADGSQSADTTAGLAVEYSWKDLLFVRAGQSLRMGEGPEGWDGAGVGFGVNWSSWSLDYGMRSHGELGWTQALQLGLHFGAKPLTGVPGPAEARSLVQAGKSKEALWVYYKHLVLHPEDIQAWLEMGDLYVQMGVPIEGKKCYSRALKLDPSNGIIRAKLDGAIH